MTTAVGRPATPVLDPAKLMPHRWKVLLGSGVLAIILGLLMLVWPGKTVLVATVLFGVALLVAGGAQLFFAMASEISGGGRALLFISGAVSVILAVLTFRYFGEPFSILLFAVYIGISFMIRGVATAVAAISGTRTSGRGWEIFFGAVSVVAGIIVLLLPYSSILTLAMVTGACLVALGVFEVVSAFNARRDPASQEAHQ
ncbi:HdeD family acid-resistance protein [Mycobacterium kyogaense]|uniref:HdeD family acid-resistance protein n=1 Tax=Mycobacterium kyogaense TaxID=2212479 RepID=UPI000DAE80E5|nr:HdeD family acid-resistance protein [Mycobacterium kyogaense]